MKNRTAHDVHRFEHHGLMTTVIDVRVFAASKAIAAEIDAAVTSELERLVAVFNAFDPASELSRWRSGKLTDPSPDFCELMALCLEWQATSNGGFNPMIDEVAATWRQAERTNSLPDRRTVADLAALIAEPRFEMHDGCPVPFADVSALNLNAIAKGFVVDRALDAAIAGGAPGLCINAGGDLAHRGAGAIPVGIENPHRPFDNEPPLALLKLHNAAMATSGNSRRGYQVGDAWFGHVIDPRTGWPVSDIASISVVAPDAATADVLATIAGVQQPSDAIRQLDDVSGVECLIVDESMRQWHTSGWTALVEPATPSSTEAPW